MQVTKQKKSRRGAAKTRPSFRRSPCAVANLLDLVGDKWSLLIVRDLLRGRSTYGQLADSPERIPTNILAERLKRLEKSSVIAKSPYQQRPVRYTYKLTKKGRDLGGLLRAIVHWSPRHLPDTKIFPEFRSQRRK